MVVRFADDKDNTTAEAITMNDSYINYRIMFISLSILFSEMSILLHIVANDDVVSRRRRRDDLKRACATIDGPRAHQCVAFFF
jgi:hypothetical protein